MSEGRREKTSPGRTDGTPDLTVDLDIVNNSGTEAPDMSAPKGKNKLSKQSTKTEEEIWLSWVESRFQEMAGGQAEIDEETFKKALDLKDSQSFFAERLFSVFDRDNSKTVAFDELMDGLNKMTKGSAEEKLKFLFDVYDADDSGTIDQDELRIVLKTCMEESSMNIDEDDLDSLTKVLFESADVDNDQNITFEELFNELQRHPGVIDNLTISAVRWLTPPTAKNKKKEMPLTRYFSRRYFINNKTKVIFYIIYTLLNVGLFILSAVRYRTSNGFIIVARGCGMGLNFNCAFIVVLMLRTCLTWLRTTRAANYLPLDHSISIHKIVGIVIAIQTVIHTVAHLGNVHVVVTASKANASGNATVIEYWEFLFTLKSGLGWLIPGFGFLSGIILDVILLIMCICSMSFVRRGGHFQVFYWTHMLYIFFWIFLFLHGPIFWCFFIVPGFIYICEVIARSRFVKLARYGKMYVKYVRLFPSQVTHLTISRPGNFRYRAGDYIFVRIPAIAQHEWHPFTISSAPELQDVLWLHIRSAGHWTKKMYDFFEETLQGDLSEVAVKSGSVKRKTIFSPKVSVRARDTVVDGAELRRYEGWKQESKLRQSDKPKEGKVKFELFVDGPYGTPTREMLNAEHAVMIGGGIGVTPFAAILQSIMFRYQSSKVTCPSCDHSWFRDTGTVRLKIKKVDFMWINRDQRCFEWFVRLLAQLEIQQAALGENTTDPFLDMHLFMTAAASRNDMKGLGLQMAMEIMHEKEKRDVLTGLRTRTQAGRPKWNDVFQRIKNKNAGKVSVFFCGSGALAKDIQEHCGRFGFSFSKENF